MTLRVAAILNSGEISVDKYSGEPLWLLLCKRFMVQWRTVRH